jgi:AcrR family transcriptional regulator
MDNISRKEKEKLAREEDIVNAAEKVLTVVGYSKASMEEIAKEAQFSRKTIYQYFPDKEDLFFSVLIRGFQRLLNYCLEGAKNGNTGFEKLKNLAFAYYSFYQDFPGTMELMNCVGYIKSKKENVAKHEAFNSLSNLVAQEIQKVINEGQTDGSIRTDLDSTYLARSSQFMLTGFFCMLSTSGNTFTNHFSLDQNDFINFNINLLCDAMH